MRALKTFLTRNKHFYLLTLLIPILLWFEYLEMTQVPQYMIHSPLDDKIPLVPAFAVFYLLWFPYVAYGLLYTGLHSRTDFCRLVLFLAGGMSIACTVYTLFPNAQDLRPAVTAADPFSAVLRFIYSVDSPTNVCPSIHVINAIGIDAALRHSEVFAEKKFRKHASFLLMTLICLSTVLIKQHSVIDAMCGILTACLLCFPLYVLPEIKTKRRSSSQYV